MKSIYYVCLIAAMLRVPTDGYSRCPVYDRDIRKKEASCGNGTRYHCFENQAGYLEQEGCFEVKQCAKGAHPVVENGAIKCDKCKTGFQRREPLPSNEFEYTYCESFKGKCEASSGYVECQAPSPEEDRKCMCSPELGYGPLPNTTNCSCFTENDSCICRFIGCPPGKVRSAPNSGRCIEQPTEKPTDVKTETGTTPSKSTSDPVTEEKPEGALQPWVIPTIIFPVLVVICLCIGLWCYLSDKGRIFLQWIRQRCPESLKRRFPARMRPSSSNVTSNGDYTPVTIPETPSDGITMQELASSVISARRETENLRRTSAPAREGAETVNPGGQSGQLDPVCEETETVNPGRQSSAAPVFNIWTSAVQIGNSVPEGNIGRYFLPMQRPGEFLANSDEADPEADCESTPMMGHRDSTDDGMEETLEEVHVSSEDDIDQTLPKGPIGILEADNNLASTMTSSETDIDQTLPKVPIGSPEAEDNLASTMTSSETPANRQQSETAL